MLVESQVVVGKLSLELPDVLDQSLVLSLQIQISLVVLVDCLNLALHLADLSFDLDVLVLKQVMVVVTIVHLSTWALEFVLHTSQTMISHWSFDCVHFGVVTDSRKVWVLSHGSGHSHTGGQSLVLHFIWR